MNKKIVNNLVSFSHASLIASGFANTYAVSTTYYLWDMLYNDISLMYLYHHISAILFILYESREQLVIDTMYYAELSNLPVCLVYHCMKLGIPCPRLQWFEVVWFGYFRIVVLGRLMLEYWTNESILYYNMCLMYFFGIYWWIKQIIKLK